MALAAWLPVAYSFVCALKNFLLKEFFTAMESCSYFFDPAALPKQFGNAHHYSEIVIINSRCGNSFLVLTEISPGGFGPISYQSPKPSDKDMIYWPLVPK